MNLRKLIFFLLLLCCASVFSQQNNATNAPLKQVLLLLEKEYNVKFSYSNDVIENKSISFKVKNQSLERVLNELQGKTKLQFKKLTNRYIAISEFTSFSVCGYVTDKISNLPLESASVISNKKGITTNKEGYFEFNKLSSKDKITISFVGYNSYSFFVKDVIDAKGCIAIKLNNNTSQLSEVLVSNYLTSGINKKNDGSIVIQPQKLGILPGLIEPDVLQSIQLLPGVRSPNETVAGMHIRGGTPDQNLILFDGIKIYNSAHFFGMISAFNPYITEKVNVFRGGAGAKYGNHISGVIDIETDKSIPQKFKGGFGTNLTHADLYFQAPITEGLGLNFSVRRSFTDLINTKTIDQISKKVFQNTIIEANNDFESDLANNSDTFYFIDNNIKINFQASEKDYFSINQLYTKNKLDYLFNFNFNMDELTTHDVLGIENYGLNLNWERKWSSKVSQKTNIYLSNYFFDYSYRGVVTGDNGYIETALKTNTIKSTGFKTSLNISLSNRSNLSLGYELDNNKVSYELSRAYSDFPAFDYLIEEKNNNNIHAFFSEFVFKNDLFVLNFGTRINHFSRVNKTFLSPRLYWEAELIENLRLKSSYEYKQQSLSQLIEFTTSDFGLENQIWILSDDVFPVLESNQFSLGFTYQANRWTFDFDFYNKNIVGLTSFIDGFNNSQEEFSNGQSKINGVDILIKKNWNKFSTWLSYGYQKNDYIFEDINNGNPFPSNFDSRHNINWTQNLRLGKFDFSLGWNYRSGTPFTKAQSINTNDFSINFGPRNQERLDEYKRVDFSTTYSFFFNKDNNIRGKLGVSLLNIFDRENILNRNQELFIDTAASNIFIGTIDNVSQGFTPNMVFRLDF